MDRHRTTGCWAAVIGKKTKKKKKARSKRSTATRSLGSKKTKRKSKARRRHTAEFGDLRKHSSQGRAIKPEGGGARISEHEHIRARTNIEIPTRHPTTGVSPYDKNAYRRSHTLTIPRDMAIDKTARDMTLHRKIVAGTASVEDMQIQADVDRTIAARDETRARRIAAGKPVADLDAITDLKIQQAAHYQQGELFDVGKAHHIEGLTQQDLDEAFDRWNEGNADEEREAAKKRRKSNAQKRRNQRERARKEKQRAEKQRRSSEKRGSKENIERRAKNKAAKRAAAAKKAAAASPDAVDEPRKEAPRKKTPREKPRPRKKDTGKSRKTASSKQRSTEPSKRRSKGRPKRPTSNAGRKNDSVKPKKTPRPSKPKIAPVPKSPTVAPKVKLKPSFSRLAAGLAKGFIIGFLQDLAIGLFVNYFENKVLDETNKRVSEALKSKVFPKIINRLQFEMKKSMKGQQPDKLVVQIGFSWTLVTRELDEDASDVVVYLGRFLAGNPGFGEIFERVEPQYDNYHHLLKWQGRVKKKGSAGKRRRVRGVDDQWRQQYTTFVLVHDPAISVLARSLKQRAAVQLKLIDAIYEASAGAIGDSDVADRRLQEAARAISKYQILTALRIVTGLKDTYTRYGDKHGASKVRTVILRCVDLIAALMGSGSLRAQIALMRRSSDERQLLNTLLGQTIDVKD